MNYEIIVKPTFQREAKRLAKHYSSFKEDFVSLIDDLEQNPLLGTDLGHGLRKVRMKITSKGKGKSGGARVITFTLVVSQQDAVLNLLYIYDKADRVSISEKEIEQLLKQNGFTECIAARRAVEDYRLQSDSLRQFLNDERYKSDVNVKTKIVDLYIEYKYYCQENGFYHLTKPNFIKRLKSYGIQVSTINVGNVAYLKKHNSDEE